VVKRIVPPKASCFPAPFIKRPARELFPRAALLQDTFAALNAHEAVNMIRDYCESVQFIAISITVQKRITDNLRRFAIAWDATAFFSIQLILPLVRKTAVEF